MASKVVVPFALMTAADIYWRKESNHRKDMVKNTKGLIPLLQPGWNGIHGLIAVEGISERSKAIGVDLVAECLARRTQQWELLKVDTGKDALIRRRVFEDMFVGKDGKLRHPKVAANVGFRRGVVWFDAQVERAKAGRELNDSVKDGSGGIPVVIRSYASDSERIREQVEENEHKEGEPTTPLDKLSAGADLYRLGWIENDLRNLFTTKEGKAGSTTGQKIFKVCRLDKAFPALNILKRLFLDVDAEGYIPYGPIDVTTLLGFMHRIDQTKDKKSGLVPPVLTEEDLAAYLLDVKGNKTPASTMMKEKNVTGLKQGDTLLVQDVAESVLKGNTDGLAKHQIMAVGYNAITNLGPTGLYPTVESVLVAALTAAKAQPNNPVACISAIMAECNRILTTLETANTQPVS